jgi:hypothetical protein
MQKENLGKFPEFAERQDVTECTWWCSEFEVVMTMTRRQQKAHYFAKYNFGDGFHSCPESLSNV